MKLLRYGSRGREKPGLLDSRGEVRDLSAHVTDLSGEFLSPESLSAIRDLDVDQLPLVEQVGRIGPCVASVGKFICVGLNYLDHIAETGSVAPTEPILFSKATSAICGPNDTIEIPRDSIKCDWEVELGVIIGRHAKYVEEVDALEYVAGYCTVNDVSERAFQLERNGQWVKGKSHDSFGPIGPWLVSRDEVPDPQSLSLWLEVDGHRYQSGNTANMVFGVAAIVAYISRFMSLQPGDVIATGTPSGVGMGQRPEPVYLAPGQQVRTCVEGLGEQCQMTTSA